MIRCLACTDAYSMRRLQDIDLRLLRTFRSIVDAGGIAGAQTTLNSSQSTLSTQLADLEKRLGFRLCQRGRRGFVLTEQGRRLVEALDDLLAAADQFQNVAASISGQMRGVLRLSLVDAMLSNDAWDLSVILREFNARAHATVIDLSIASPTDMQLLLLERKCDLAVGPISRPAPGLSERPLFQELHALYCATNHPLARIRTVGPEALQPYPFVARGYLHRYDMERVGQVKPAALVDTMESQALLIRSGRFIGYLPCHYAAGLEGLVRIDAAPGIDYLSTIKLIYRSDSADNILVRSFLNRVTEHPLRPGPLTRAGLIRSFEGPGRTD